MVKKRRDYGEAVLSLAKEIFKKNEQWIMDSNVNTQYPLPDPEEDSETLKFFEEYKRLGGKDELEKYTNNLRTFFKITFESYVNGDLSKPIEGESWESADEPWMCFVGFMQSLEEAKRYFESVDNIHPYT
jgi:hypothetical protein